MPEVRLSRVEAESDYLPRICMRCGAPATQAVERNFSYVPTWAYLLILCGLFPYLIVAMFVQEHIRLAAPLCAQHQNHWSVRRFWTWAAFLVMLGLAFLGMNGPNEVRELLCLGVFLGFVGWAAVAVVANETSIHPTEITIDDMRLVQVSPAFIAALHRYRGGVSAANLEEQEYFQPPGAEKHPGPGDQFYDPRS